jgi:trehalose 6-phosphate synthase/phosphatase
MSKVIIISNRLPFKINLDEHQLTFTSSSGGLATGLSSIHQNKESVWIGWTGLTEEDIPCTQLKDEIIEETIARKCIPVSLTQKEIDLYYYGFSNGALWPLFHYFLCYTKYNNKIWEAYQKVNEKFAETIADHAESGDTVWVHDYQLLLVPHYLRKKNLNVSIGFFLHIPFPAYEVFRSFPYRKEILQGMLGADIIGFHTFDYQQCFLKSVHSLSPYSIHGNEIRCKNHTAEVHTFPMGIDTHKFTEAVKQQKKSNHPTSDIQLDLKKYREENPNVKLILSIDRLDYTKGILNRIRAFDYFLKHNPNYKGKVCLIMLSVPSRTDVEQYKLLKKEVDELVGRINGKYATIGWTPIWYYFRSLPFEDLIHLYSTCEIALITPLRDGMNLVAKEYVCSRDQTNTGVLILSELTGAAHEMEEAILINPNSFPEISRALVTAIEMPKKEQQKRNKALQKKLHQNNVYDWAANFMNQLYKNSQINNKQPVTLTDSILNNLLKQYKKSSRRKFFLDYDGTLVGFKNQPQDANPDKALLHLLSHLGNIPENELFIVSGRKKQDLEQWFSGLRISLIAEHGLYIRNDHVNWIKKSISNKMWKNEVKFLFEIFTERTKGSFIEEKDESLAWHYRQSPLGLGIKKAKELKELLNDLAEKHEIKIIFGNKVIEVVNNHIHKGIAVGTHLEESPGDFIIAIGDDKTDECMFKNLPIHAITIKVGTAPTVAKYRVGSFKEVRSLLNKLMCENIKPVPKHPIDISSQLKKDFDIRTIQASSLE